MWRTGQRLPESQTGDNSALNGYRSILYSLRRKGETGREKVTVRDPLDDAAQFPDMRPQAAIRGEDELILIARELGLKFLHGFRVNHVLGALPGFHELHQLLPDFG